MKAKKKFLVIDQGLRNAILKDYELREENVGFVLENVIGVHLLFHRKGRDNKVFYWKANDEIDFVVTNKEIIPVEVKYKNRIAENDKKSLIHFLKKFKKNKAILITKTLYGQEKVSSGILHLRFP